MSESGYLFICRVVAARARVVCFPACFCAGGRLSIVMYQIMSECRNHNRLGLCFEQNIREGCCIYRLAVRLTGGRRGHGGGLHSLRDHMSPIVCANCRGRNAGLILRPGICGDSIVVADRRDNYGPCLCHKSAVAECRRIYGRSICFAGCRCSVACCSRSLRDHVACIIAAYHGCSTLGIVSGPNVLRRTVVMAKRRSFHVLGLNGEQCILKGGSVPCYSRSLAGRRCCNCTCCINSFSYYMAGVVSTDRPCGNLGIVRSPLVGQNIIVMPQRRKHCFCLCDSCRTCCIGEDLAAKTACPVSDVALLCAGCRVGRSGSQIVAEFGDRNRLCLGFEQLIRECCSICSDSLCVTGCRCCDCACDRDCLSLVLGRILYTYSVGRTGSIVRRPCVRWSFIGVCGLCPLSIESGICRRSEFCSIPI